jgi:hypothetical protein
VAESVLAMSTSPSRSVHQIDFSTWFAPSQDADDERTTARAENAQFTNTHLAKDGGLLSALAALPDFPFADATSHLVERKSDDQAQLTATSPPEMTGDSDLKRHRTIVSVPPNEHEIHLLPCGSQSSLFDFVPASVVRSCRSIDLGCVPTPVLRRPHRALRSVKAFLVMSAIAASFAAYFVLESSPPATDVADLQELAFDETRRVTPPSLPQSAPLSNEFRSSTVDGGAERETQAVSPRPTASLQFSSTEKDDGVLKSPSSDFAISDDKRDLKTRGKTPMVMKRRAPNHAGSKQDVLKNKNTPACSGLFQFCSIYSLLFGVDF